MSNYNKAIICTKCNGVGKRDYDVPLSGGWVLAKREDCKGCNGVGEFREWVDDRSFESELHDLITKYNLDHTTLTPEFIKQQIMRDNITTHNEELRDKQKFCIACGGSGWPSIHGGPCKCSYCKGKGYTTEEDTGHLLTQVGAKDRQREKGDE